MSLLPKCTCGYSGTCRPSYEGCTNKLHPSESAGVNEVDHWKERALNAESKLDSMRDKQVEGVKGAVWVKASDRLPKNFGEAVFIKHDGLRLIGTLYDEAKIGDEQKPCFYFSGEDHFEDQFHMIEWLDESEAPTASGDGKEDITDHEHEKEVMMQAFDKVRQLFEGRSWIMEGRGSYPYDDDRYKEEVRYMYDEFDALFKDTWANIKSKSFEYRSKIIEQYKKDSGKEDAVAFVDWGHDNVKGYDPIAEKWIYGDNEERYTTSQLYDIYKQSK